MTMESMMTTATNELASVTSSLANYMNSAITSGRNLWYTYYYNNLNNEAQFTYTSIIVMLGVIALIYILS